MNEQEILKKRITELSRRAYERGYATNTDFLNLDEISTLKTLSLPCYPLLFGGYENAERCVAGFGDMDESMFPIHCIKIQPVQQKFADKLNHRDFLGSLMNLGINRATLGDIKIKDNVGYLFCLDSISEYIIDSLDRIKHTSVKCELINEIPDFLTQLPDEEEIIVSSLRADVVIATIYKLSRNATSQLFNQDKVYINSRLCSRESVLLKDNDIISARGFGKFIYSTQIRKTKKDRMVIAVRIYK